VVLESFKHLERLNGEVEGLLRIGGVELGDLRGVLLSLGPGFFTSLRVGAAFTKAVHLIFGVPMYGFNTLQVAAVGLDDGRYVLFSDARKGQLYAQSFKVKEGVPKEDGVVPLGIYPGDFPPPEGYTMVEADSRLRAYGMFLLFDKGFFTPLSPTFSPLYVREPDAVVNLTGRRYG